MRAHAELKVLSVSLALWTHRELSDVFLTRIAQIIFEPSIDFTSFPPETHGVGSKKRFCPPDFNEFHPNDLIHNGLRYFCPVSYGKSGLR